MIRITYVDTEELQAKIHDDANIAESHKRQLTREEGSPLGW